MNQLGLFIGLTLLGVALFGFTELLRIYGSEALLGEHGPIELAQLGLLLSGIFVLSMFPSHGASRAIVAPFILLLAAIVTRELDGPLDHVFHGSWKYPAWAFALSAGYLLVGNRTKVMEAYVDLSRSRASGLLFGAGFVVFVQSRVLGRQVVWQAALGDEYRAAIPRLVEELSELAGYGLLLLACIDIVQSAMGHRACRVRPQA